ncbi:hypothetical protein LTR56_009171 [Elasticomyces elasticus]|nr:hypothetical protein LTR56_009171 [Elasticomyces elasticus]KAK3660593.1 hypothetical protein LTR22_007840 [Elasticomyces elasticus]KAK4915605.1 hypothetical protein LTR49_016328 [Elasticomyces elasticus]KAK5755030.1 hypothetical protein LTS12_014830 [Elasticomyces elasticus]
MGMSGHASGEAVVAVSIAMTVLAAASVISRLATRVGIVRNAGIDDAFITVALLFSIATTVTLLLQVKYGMGQHQDTLSEQDQLLQLRPFWASIWVYNLAISCTKFSILFQYLRIFPGRKFRATCYALIGVVFVYSCWTFFSAIFACTPVEYFWKPNRPGGGKCLDRFAVWFANAGINIVTDIATGVLPLPVFNSLELPKRQKIALMSVFALGGFTCVVSILRLQSLYVISRATDVSWNNPLAAIWSSVEINTGILCSCLPTLKACVSRYLPRLFTTKLSRAGSRPSHARGASKYHKNGTRSKMSFQELGQGLDGRGQAVQRSMIQSNIENADNYDMGSMGSMPKGYELDNGQIQVVTVLEQEEHQENDYRAETDSMKGLVRETFYQADRL